MAYNMKGNPFQRNFGIGISPLKTGFDYSKKADYSKEKTSKTFGAKFAKAVTPENTPMGVLTSMIPLGKAAKWGKMAYNYFKG